jgi:hypothetical protein
MNPFVRIIDSGPVLEKMAATLDGVASQSGVSTVFRWNLGQNQIGSALTVARNRPRRDRCQHDSVPCHLVCGPTCRADISGAVTRRRCDRFATRRSDRSRPPRNSLERADWAGM